ncbi:MAG: histidine phosphatase family protein [Lachnospiraceae bacterium]
MNIILLRHGKTKGNLQHRYVGRTDEELLPETGEKLMAAAPAFQKKYLAGRRVIVLTSPLRRCVRTAQILTYGAGNCEMRVVPDFRETDFGAFEYRNFAELDGNPDYQRFIDSDGEAAFPGGESKKQAKERVTAAFETQMSAFTAEAKPDVLLLVVHGGTIMALMDRYAVPHRPYYEWHCENLAGFAGRLEAAPAFAIKEAEPLCLKC